MSCLPCMVNTLGLFWIAQYSRIAANVTGEPLQLRTGDGNQMDGHSTDHCEREPLERRCFRKTIDGAFPLR
ncbi:hypothetical protein HHUSO_G12524 [Huso huso]|uniref:Secreted protein n=1 Tax=Huso huso TaxID=61971 RepID=A0ABR0ZIV3_HUSHU